MTRNEKEKKNCWPINKIHPTTSSVSDYEKAESQMDACVRKLYILRWTCALFDASRNFLFPPNLLQRPDPFYSDGRARIQKQARNPAGEQLISLMMLNNLVLTSRPKQLAGNETKLKIVCLALWGTTRPLWSRFVFSRHFCFLFLFPTQRDKRKEKQKKEISRKTLSNDTDDRAPVFPT